MLNRERSDLVNESKENNAVEDHVILVNRNDVEVGIAPKTVVHRRGDLHRAVSVFISMRAAG